MLSRYDLMMKRTAKISKAGLSEKANFSHVVPGDDVELISYIDDLTSLKSLSSEQMPRLRKNPNALPFLSQIKKTAKCLIDTSTCIGRDEVLDTVVKVPNLVSDKRQISLKEVKHAFGTQHTLREEFKDDLIEFYRTQHSTLPMSPILEKSQEAPLKEFYIRPKVKQIAFKEGAESRNLTKDSGSLHEMFTDGEKECRSIYLTSPKGNGKTCFAKYMTLVWCQSQNPEQDSIVPEEDLNDIEKFELIFFLSLKDSLSKECDIRDMVFSQIIQNMEHSYKYSFDFLGQCMRECRCLVILDGLDEWFQNSECKMCKEMAIPHIQMDNQCTFFTTCSPSKLSSLKRRNIRIDKWLDLEGLDEHSSELLVRKTISYLNSIFLEQESDVPSHEDRNENVHFKSTSVILMNILSLWFDGEPSGSTLCEIYGYMLELLFTKNIQKLQNYGQSHKTQRADQSFRLPQVFKPYINCARYSNVLRAYGKLAFDMLFPPNRNVSNFSTFSRSEMETYLSNDEISMGLDLGIISVEQPQQLYRLQRSYQEFLAAMYISCATEEGSKEGSKTRQILATCDSADECVKFSKFFLFVKEMDDKSQVYNEIVAALKGKFTMLFPVSWEMLAAALHISEDDPERSTEDEHYAPPDSESTSEDKQVTSPDSEGTPESVHNNSVDSQNTQQNVTTGALNTFSTHMKEQSLSSAGKSVTAFRKRLIQHYRQTLAALEAGDLLQHINVKVFPIFKPDCEEHISCESVSTLHSSVLSFIESLHLDPNKNGRLVVASEQPEEIDGVAIDILNTWICSVENEEHFSEDDVNIKEYDAVLFFQNHNETEYYTTFDSFVYSNLAKELNCSPEGIKNELSCCRKCLVLLGNTNPSFVHTPSVKSPFHTICFTTDMPEQRRLRPSVNNFVASRGRILAISMKSNTVLTRNDGYELEKWIKSHCKMGKHNVIFENMRTDTETSIELGQTDTIATIEIRNCDSSFFVKHVAETLRLHGISISNIDSWLEHSHNLENLCLNFEDYKNGTTCHPLKEKTIEGIVGSVEKCQRLQNIYIERFSVGKHKEISCCITRSAIEHINNDKTANSVQTICSSLLGPTLVKTDFDKSDVEMAESQFTKRIILNSLCHKLVKSNENILEAYASVQTQSDPSEISFVCFLKAGTCETTQLHKYRGFSVVKKEYRSVSTESIIAEAETNDLEYDIGMYQEALRCVISFNVENLFKDHSNLEAVCGSMVRSTSSKIDTSAPCVVLYCRWKGMIPYGENEFPKELTESSGKNSFATDVREGYFMFGPNGTTLTGGATDWNKELAMGCSIGAKNGAYSATLGPFLNVCGSDRTCFLTVRHMFQPLNIDDLRLRGTKIVQPADGDELVNTHGTMSNKPLEERLCGEVLFSHFGDQVDAAVVQINQNRMPVRGNFVGVTKDALGFAGFGQSSFPTFDDGKLMDATTFTVADHATDRIIKFGRQTGLTRGSFDLQDMAVKIKDESKLSIHFNGVIQSQVMKHQLKIKSYVDCPFFLREDSGSAVFLADRDNKLHCIGMAIGLLTDGTCVVTPIQKLLEILNKESPHGLNFELKIFDFEQMHT